MKKNLVDDRASMACADEDFKDRVCRYRKSLILLLGSRCWYKPNLKVTERQTLVTFRSHHCPIDWCEASQNRAKTYTRTLNLQIEAQTSRPKLSLVALSLMVWWRRCARRIVCSLKRFRLVVNNC